MLNIGLPRNKLTKNEIELNAIIIAHNYQRAEIQDIADYTGDSLELARIAADVKCDVIVFCGVNFMAESASILSPDKTVLLPAKDAFCPMADMITVSGERKIRDQFPGFKYEDGYQYPADFTLMDIRTPSRSTGCHLCKHHG